MAGVEGFGADLAGAMLNVTDLVAILDAGGRVEHMNPYGLELLGASSLDELVGASMVDLIHPDDLAGVLTSMGRMMDPAASVPGRPLRMRVRRSDGTYVRVEANGAVGTTEGSTGRAVVTARPTTDADLHDQLMALLTTGAPSEKSFELVPDFGAWRQPNLLHAVFVLDDDGVPLAFGSPLLVELGGLDDEGAPWAAVVRRGDELLAPVDDLDGPAAARARARGLTRLRARPVPDALHRSNAAVVMARHESSPLPDEPQTLDFSWFAFDKMCAVLEMALAWRHQAVELRRAARTDPLTGLANRAGFWTDYRDAADAGAGVSVLFIDLDRFKPVNDTFGHGVGDALLVLVADRLRAVVRPTDLVARLGGDEFVVVVRDLADDEVASIAARIVAELAQPFAVHGHTVEIGASIGVAGSAADELDADALLEAADRALYDAKNTGRSRWVRR